MFAHAALLALLPAWAASVASIGTLLVPVIGVAAGAVFLSEPFGWREIVALISIVGGVALVLLVPEKEPAPQPVSARQ